MLERILGKAVYLLLERLALWAAEEAKKYLDMLQQNKADEEARKKLQEAATKEEKLRHAKDLVDSATRPQS